MPKNTADPDEFARLVSLRPSRPGRLLITPSRKLGQQFSRRNAAIVARQAGSLRWTRLDHGNWDKEVDAGRRLGRRQDALALTPPGPASAEALVIEKGGPVGRHPPPGRGDPDSGSDWRAKLASRTTSMMPSPVLRGCRPAMCPPANIRAYVENAAPMRWLDGQYPDPVRPGLSIRLSCRKPRRIADRLSHPYAAALDGNRLGKDVENGAASLRRRPACSTISTGISTRPTHPLYQAEGLVHAPFEEPRSLLVRPAFRLKSRKGPAAGAGQCAVANRLRLALNEAGVPVWNARTDKELITRMGASSAAGQPQGQDNPHPLRGRRGAHRRGFDRTRRCARSMPRSAPLRSIRAAPAATQATHPVRARLGAGNDEHAVGLGRAGVLHSARDRGRSWHHHARCPAASGQPEGASAI